MKRPDINDFIIKNTGPEESPYNTFEYSREQDKYINYLENKSMANNKNL